MKAAFSLCLSGVWSALMTRIILRDLSTTLPGMPIVLDDNIQHNNRLFKITRGRRPTWAILNLISGKEKTSSLTQQLALHEGRIAESLKRLKQYLRRRTARHRRITISWKKESVQTGYCSCLQSDNPSVTLSGSDAHCWRVKAPESQQRTST